MAYVTSKKLAPLLILRILQKHSDREHPMTQSEIAAKLEDEYGLQMERKAIGRNIALLNELDDLTISTVEKEEKSQQTGSGVYLVEREFLDTELRLIIDSLSGNRFLSDWETKDLIDRVAKLSNKHFQKKIGHYRFVGSRGKTENKTVLFNMEEIDRAISGNKQIRFDLLATDKDGKKEIAWKNQTATPVQFLVKEQEYYLLIAHTTDGECQFDALPLDMLTNVEPIDAPADDIRKIPQFKHGIDYDKLLREHPNLNHFRGKATRCTFHCNRHMLDRMKEHFGSDIRVSGLEPPEQLPDTGHFLHQYKKDILEVSVVTDPYAALEFAWQNPEGIWVVSPPHINCLVRQRLQYQQEYYQYLDDFYGAGRLQHTKYQKK